MLRSAIISDCRLYRYTLWREWGSGAPCVFIGLNPSTADETNDDPTIRRCMAYAVRWGFNSLCMLNLFAYRATRPQDMMSDAAFFSIDPVGPDNNQHLLDIARTAGIVVAAWGKDGKFRGRNQEVIEMLPNLHCLKRNGDGSPGHPLYLRGDLVPVPFVAT